MAEQTQAQAPVSQAPPSDEQSIASMAAFLERHDKESAEAEGRIAPEPDRPTAPPPAEVKQAEGQAPETAELTPEDIPDGEQPAEGQPALDAFEIVHNGQTVKLTRAEAIEHAQQGFDYVRKTQAVAETQRQLQERMERVQQIEQVVPFIAQDQAQVAALEGQLKQYQNVDWVQLASTDPLDYSKHRAQYDVLVGNYQQAVGRLNQKAQAVGQHMQQIRAQNFQTEAQRMVERIPEWKDEAKYQQGAAELRNYLVAEGADPRAVGSLGNNSGDSVLVALGRKAMFYDKLVKAKAEKVKQLRTAPPVTRPGASSPPSQAQAEKGQQLESRLKKTGDIRVAAAILANRWK
jgi:hypothetical protein